MENIGRRGLVCVFWSGGRLRGVVVEGETDSFRDGGMTVGPKDQQRIWGRVVVALLSEFLKGAGGDLAVVGKEGVGNFQAVDVGFVLLVATEGVSDGFRDQGE